jgi:hypothetical protein
VYQVEYSLTAPPKNSELRGLPLDKLEEIELLLPFGQNLANSPGFYKILVYIYIYGQKKVSSKFGPIHLIFTWDSASGSLSLLPSDAHVTVVEWRQALSDMRTKGH